MLCLIHRHFVNCKVNYISFDKAAILCIHCVGLTIMGGVVLYSTFWVLYAFHLFLKVAYPQHAMSLDNLHQRKKIYYFEVGCAFTVGALPYIILVSLSEYRIVNFPPIFCALSPEGNFYGIVFPTLILNCTTLIILLLVLYHVHIVSDCSKNTLHACNCDHKNYFDVTYI